MLVFFCRARGENAEDICKFYCIVTHSVYLLSPVDRNDSWHTRTGKRFRKSQSEVEFTEKPDWLHGGGRLICEVCKSADAPADSYLDRWDETTL
jgi:hypothetical protein